MLALIAQYRALAIGLAVAALMGLAATSAWQWQANSYGRQIADIRAGHAEQLRLIAQAGADTLRAQSRARTLLQTELGLQDAQHYQELQHAQDTTDRLVADLAAERLSVRVTAPASAPRVPTATDARRVDDGAGSRAELHPATAAGLVRVAGEADQCAVKLTALQAWARAVSGR